MFINMTRFLAVLAFMFTFEAAGAVTTNPAVILTGPATEDPIRSYFIETAIGAAGDVNGDGIDDLVVGDPHASTTAGGTHSGALYLYYGSPSGLSNHVNWAYQGTRAFHFLGTQVGCAGDVNGDGFDDLFASASEVFSGMTKTGYVAVIHGSASGPLGAPAVELMPDINQIGWAWRAGGIGDVNNDGFDDFALAALDSRKTTFPSGLYTNPSGRVHVFYGSSTGLSPVADVVLLGTDYGHEWMTIGHDLGPAGDVNGDGFQDLLLSEMAVGSMTDIGYLNVFFGSPSGVAVTGANCRVNYESVLSVFGTNPAPWVYGFGFSACAAGDINNDEYDDIAVSAVTAFTNWADNERPGFVTVLAGCSNGISSNVLWYTAGTTPYTDFERWGYTMSPAGDVNGDGLGDLLLGTRAIDDGDKRRAHIFLGSTNGGYETTAAWTSLAPLAHVDIMRNAQAAIGDVNADGFDDIAIGRDDDSRDDIRVHYGSPDNAAAAAMVFDEEGGEVLSSWQVPVLKPYFLEEASGPGMAWSAASPVQTSIAGRVSVPLSTTNATAIFRIQYAE